MVDRRTASTGGMNIGEEYGSPRTQPGQVWRDTHVRVEGPAAWEMAVVFAEAWARAGGRPFDIEPLPAEEAAEEIFREDLESSREILPSDWRRRRVPHRLGDRLARCLSPLL